MAWDRLPGADDAGQVALEQGDAGALDGDVGAGAHREADVGGGQGGCVVDAVAGHGHDAALGAQALDDVALVVGQHLGLDAVDAEAAADGLGGDPVVAGEHDDLDAVFPQRLERGRGGLLDRVGDGEDAGDVGRRCPTKMAVAPSARSRSASPSRRRCPRPGSVRKLLLPRRTRRPSTVPSDALADGGVEVA